MKSSNIRLIVFLGVLAIAGIVSIQTYWLLKAFDLKEKQFNQTVQIALLDVADRMAEFNGKPAPYQNPVNQLASDYYIVNVNDVIDANVLDYSLKTIFIKHGLDIDFEYAIYDCADNRMVYGDYISYQESQPQKPKSVNLPTYNEYVYYFGVKFPNRTGYLAGSMRFWIVFSGILLVAVLFFAYAIFTILSQKRLSELQKDFINNMTHEFKTPISSINISADVLMKDSYIQTDSRLLGYAKIIKAQNERLNQQVENVLQIARIEGKNFTLKKEKTDLPAFIGELMEAFQLQAEEKGGKIVFINELGVKTEKTGEISAENSGFLNLDRLHFGNVLHSLIDNSLKYCKNKPNVEICLKREKGRLILSITDNGIGMSKEYSKRAFDKFYRVPTGNIHDVKGFGLGLFYVKKVCSIHNWKIEINSFPGLGTTVQIRF